MSKTDSHKWVGPVLQTGTPLTEAILKSLQADNSEIKILDRGSYLRVTSLNECRLEAKTVESITGQTFHLPSDLEVAMCSFKGQISIYSDYVVWRSE